MSDLHSRWRAGRLGLAVFFFLFVAWPGAAGERSASTPADIDPILKLPHSDENVRLVLHPPASRIGGTAHPASSARISGVRGSCSAGHRFTVEDQDAISRLLDVSGSMRQMGKLEGRSRPSSSS
jgi:hypothetical protein